jgi:hypothetical protein
MNIRATTYKLIFLITSSLMFFPTAGAIQNKQTPDRNCCAKVLQALDAVNNLKKGMTRAEVEKVFRLEGGLFSRNQSFYVYRDCPYIKVQVTFDLDPEYKDFVTGSPKDIVQSVSKPYLEYPVTD